MATLVRASPSQLSQQGGALTFPLQLSQVKTVNKTGVNAQKQQQSSTSSAPQMQQLNPAFQQQIILQRQKQQLQAQQQQQFQAPTASKMVQMGQVRSKKIVILLKATLTFMFVF